MEMKGYSTFSNIHYQMFWGHITETRWGKESYPSAEMHSTLEYDRTDIWTSNSVCAPGWEVLTEAHKKLS